MLTSGTLKRECISRGGPGPHREGQPPPVRAARRIAWLVVDEVDRRQERQRLVIKTTGATRVMIDSLGNLQYATRIRCASVSSSTRSRNASRAPASAQS
jgi:hypothetical protein